MEVVRVEFCRRVLGTGALAAAVLFVSCSLDRAPRLSKSLPVSGRGPQILQRGGGNTPTGGQFGNNPTPSTPNQGPQVGGLSCGGVFCPFTAAPMQPCCTEADDVERGAAREVDRCGVDFSSTASPFFADTCWQRDQLGVLDDRCASIVTRPGVEEPGCCSDRGVCGSWNAEHMLGCHYELDAEATPCGGEDIVDEVECDPLGVFGVRSDIDVTWGGRDGGLAALTDDGRGTITIHLKVTIEDVDALGTLRGKIQPCGVQLPPFYSTTLCESYQAEFPPQIWESPTLPEIELQGRYQCLNPGCILTLDAQTNLLGVELENPEAPWPNAAETYAITCGHGSGIDCFPDHDDDGLPGLSIAVRAGGVAPVGPTCTSNRYYDYKGAPLSANPLAIFDGVRRTDHILLGTRVKLGGAGKISEDCNTGDGEGTAEFVQSRAWSCFVQEGTANWGGDPAGPDEPCTTAEASFMDENLPIYTVLRFGEYPDAGLSLSDTSVSAGPQFGIVRLGKLGDSVTCEDVRAAAYP